MSGVASDPALDMTLSKDVKHTQVGYKAPDMSDVNAGGTLGTQRLNGWLHRISSTLPMFLLGLGAINTTPSSHFSSMGAEKHSNGVETPI